MQHANTPAPAAQEQPVEVFQYLESIVRYRKQIVRNLVVALAVAAAIVYLCLPKIYCATAQILPPQQDQGLMAMMLGGAGGGLSSLAGGLLGAGTPADQYASILESERVRKSIIQRFKLMEVYEQTYLVDMYEQMEKLVEVKAGKKDGIISISVEDEDPKRAAAIANAYVEELNRFTVEMNASGGGQNRSFLETRLATARADLARAEEGLKAFQSKNKALDVPSQAKATIEGVALLKAQLTAQEGVLAGLRSRFTDRSQEVMDQKALIGDINGQIAKLEGKGGASSILSMGNVPDLGQQYIRLMREFKIQETLVELLTKQYELAKLTESKTVSGIQVIQKAEAPDKKVKPKRILILLGVALLTLVLSASWAVVVDYLGNMPEKERDRWLRIKAIWAGQR